MGLLRLETGAGAGGKPTFVMLLELASLTPERDARGFADAAAP